MPVSQYSPVANFNIRREIAGDTSCDPEASLPWFQGAICATYMAALRCRAHTVTMIRRARYGARRTT